MGLISTLGSLTDTKAMFITFCMLCLALSSYTVKAEEEANDDGGDMDSTVVLLFMFFGLAVGIVLMQLLSKIGEAIPYTCAVFMLGLLFAGLTSSNDTLGRSINNWVQIDADLLVFIFLPPLVFAEAMNLNWHHAKRGFLQSVILAGPGVVIGAVLMGVATKFILPYDWDWNLVMTFGSILAATDTVAVVSLLKRVGAAPTLTTLIVGESLLNDGTAMVLFTVFYNALNGKTYTAGGIIAFLLQTILGSVALGVCVGFLTVRWLRTATRPLKDIDVMTQIAITICSAYLVFFVAQYEFEISGVLAVCSAGAMLAWLAPPIILSHETMHNVWGIIEWALNTLIFLIAGLIIGHRVLGKVHAMDWLYLFILYAVLMGVRTVTIAVLFPFISGIGHRCTRNGAIFMSWAGLRGALGMALALLVENNCPAKIKDETSRMFFYVGGIAALTLIINATTAKSLLYHLDLVGTDSAEKSLVTDRIKKKLRRKMDKVIVHMAKEFAFTEEDLEEVRMSCTLLNDMNMDALYRDTMVDDVLPDFRSVSTSQQCAIPSRIPVPNSNSLIASSPSEQAYLSTSPPPTHLADQHAHRHLSTGTGSRSAALHTTLRQDSLISQDDDSHESYSSSDEEQHQSRSQQHSSVSRLVQATSLGLRSPSSAAGGGGGGRSVSTSAKARSLHINRMSRMLSMSARGKNPVLIQELLVYVRAVFLEIVKVKYWHFIEVGKLPRQSHSAQFLLYSIEVGLDEVQQPHGSRDWHCLEQELQHAPVAMKVLQFLDDSLPYFLTSRLTTPSIANMESKLEKRAVYMLTSFIEAHEHAQKKIHSFLGLEDEEGGQTPEESKVINESTQAIANARLRLNNMNKETVSAIRSKQAARLVLSKEAEMVKSMVHEGLLSPAHAEEFLEEISADTEKIEQERNRMYKDHAVKKGQRMQAVKFEEYERRSSLFSLFMGQGRPSEQLYSPVMEESLMNSVSNRSSDL